MQVIAIGKWSKTLKRWQTVVSFRRPSTESMPRRPPTRPSSRPTGAS
jgi:hypothetical protein